MNASIHPNVLWNDFGDDSWVCNACGATGSSDQGYRPEDIKCTRPLSDKDLDSLETEEEFLAHYDLKKYDAVGVTTDLAIFTIVDDKLCMPLIKRGGHPFKGMWALPGGFVNVKESLDEGIARELGEETSLSIDSGYLEQLKTYGRPGRDPRGYIVSVAYVALVPQVAEPKHGDDAADARFFPVDEILSEDFPLAFDHRDIISDGLERVRAKLEYAPIAPKFLDAETFTISELRRIYEIVWGVSMNTSNFRRKLKNAKGFLIPVNEKRQSNVAGGRESDLYKLGDIQLIFPPLRQGVDAEL